MKRFMQDFDLGSYYVGAFVGVLFVLFFSWFGSFITKDSALDNCAKTNNVYQCEMVAVPKTGEVN